MQKIKFAILIAVNLALPILFWFTLLPIPVIPSDDQALKNGIEQVELCFSGKIESPSSLCIPKPTTERYYTKPTLFYLGGIVMYLTRVSSIEAMSLLNFISLGFLMVLFLFSTMADYKKPSLLVHGLVSFLILTNVSLGASLLWNGYGVLQCFLTALFGIAAIKVVRSNSKMGLFVSIGAFSFSGALLFFLHMSGLFWIGVTLFSIIFLNEFSQLKKISIKNLSIKHIKFNSSFFQKIFLANSVLLTCILVIDFYSKYRFGGYSYFQDFKFGLSENRYMALSEVDVLSLKSVLPIYYFTVEILLVALVILTVRFLDLKQVIKQIADSKLNYTNFLIVFSLIGFIFLTFLNNEKLLRLLLPLQLGLFALIQYGFYSNLSAFRTRILISVSFLILFIFNIYQLKELAQSFTQLPHFFTHYVSESKGDVFVLKNDPIWNKIRNTKLSIYYPGKNEQYIDKKLLTADINRVVFVKNLKEAIGKVKKGDFIVSGEAIRDRFVLIKQFNVVPFNMTLANQFQAPVKKEFLKKEILRFDFLKLFFFKEDANRVVTLNVYQK